jgi:hypothetical protein
MRVRGDGSKRTRSTRGVEKQSREAIRHHAADPDPTLAIGRPEAPRLAIDPSVFGKRSKVSLSIAKRWEIAFGREPALGARTPDDAPPRTVAPCTRPLPISAVMADLHRRSMPILNDARDVDRMIGTMGLRPQGTLARELKIAAGRALSKRLCWQLDGVTEGMPIFKPSLEIFTRHVLAEVFSAAVDEEGSLNLDRLRLVHGRDVDLLIRWIGSRDESVSIKQYEDAPFELGFVDPERGAFPGLSAAIVREQRTRQRDSMQIVRELAEQFGDDGRNDVVILRQHGFGSNLELAQTLGRRNFLIDKNYSASVPVKLFQKAESAVRVGVTTYPVIDNAGGRALIDSYELGFRGEGEMVPMHGRIHDALHLGDSEPIRHLQLVDEGASGILALHEILNLPPIEAPFYGHTPNWYGFGSKERLFASVSAVEHTRDGIRVLKDRLGLENLEFAVINAAESPVKLLMVGVLIAWSAIEEIERARRDLEAQGVKTDKTVCVAGYGSTGTMVARLLRSMDYRVVVLENDPQEATDPAEARRAREAIARAGADGFDVICKLPEQLDVAMVAGCTGLPWFKQEMGRRFRSGTLLFSVSSSTKEFPFERGGPWKVVNQLDEAFRIKPTAVFQGRKIRLGLESYDRSHWNRLLETDDGHQLLLMNSSYPINFTGGPDPIAPFYIQLTRALNALGAFQARKLPPGTKGLIDLDPVGQRFIAVRWMELMGKLDPPIPKEVRVLLDDAYRETLRELDKLTGASRHEANARG